MSEQNKEQPKDNSKGDGQAQPTIEQLTKATRYVFSEMQKISGSLKELADWRQEVATKLAPPQDTGNPRDKGEPDLEVMSNKELVEHVVKELSEKILKPVNAQITSVSNELQRTKGQGEIKEVSSKYPDFWEFKDEIEARVKSNPGLSLDDAYTLARKDNATKATEIDTKAREEREAKEREASTETVFGGLLPTSLPVAPNQKMTPKEASEAAWEEHMSGFKLH